MTIANWVNLRCMATCSYSVMMASMSASTRLYPLELFRLLEAMWDDSFSGSIVLRSRDETATLYLSDGQVRYATTSALAGSFPGYLLTEELFSRDEVHAWLEHCSGAQRTLEDHLLEEDVLDLAPSSP